MCVCVRVWRSHKHLRSHLTASVSCTKAGGKKTCLRSSSRHAASFPARSHAAVSACVLEGGSNGGRGLWQWRGGAGATGTKAPANLSALRRRPITGLPARQICPAVRGGAAGSPSAAGYTSERLREARGRGSVRQEATEG